MMNSERNYPKEINKIFQKKYICPYCDQIFLNVSQASCGDRYCKTCIDDLISRNMDCVLCCEKLYPNETSSDKAHNREISNVFINCLDCAWNGRFIDYIQHYNQDHFKNICEFCNKKFATIELLSTHADKINGDCELIPLKCPYSIIGCDCKEPLNRRNIEKHREEFVTQHMLLVYKHSRDKIDNLRTQNSENKILAIEERKIPSSSTNNKEQDETNKDKEFKFKLTEESQIKLMKDIWNCTSELENMAMDVVESKRNIENLTGYLEETRKLLLYRRTSIINFEERLLVQRRIANNGLYIWKISGFNEKVKDAKLGKQESLYSPPFYSNEKYSDDNYSDDNYSSDYGYKLACRIYLNGHAGSAGTHISIYLVILKGDFDDLLRWPFGQKITFAILDQVPDDRRDNISESFRPSPSATAFQKPVGEVNTASGLEKFCPLAKIYSTDHSYIREDCIFVKISIGDRNMVPSNTVEDGSSMQEDLSISEEQAPIQIQ